MKILKLIFLSCAMAVVSCSSQSHLNSHKFNSGEFYIDESALAKGVLRLHLPEDKPKSLSIKTPGGEWFVLQDSDESIEIMPQTRFDSLNKMEFEIKKLQGTTWRKSEKITENVFKTSGKYLIYFANNLETEPENTFSLQKIIYYIKPK